MNQNETSDDSDRLESASIDSASSNSKATESTTESTRTIPSKTTTSDTVLGTSSESVDVETTSNQNYNDEIIAALKLKMTAGIGPRLFGDLVKKFGSPLQVLEAPPAELRDLPGVGAKLVSAIVAAEQIDVQTQLDLCQSNGIEILAQSSVDYPQSLYQIYDPPSVLFCAGTLKPVDDMAVAIVGTRHATHYGKKVAESLARGLALAGITVVSGMARGIDAVAHRAALDAGGRTIAVLGGGLMNVYPPEHEDLAREISRQGAVLSEALPRVAPKSGCFPRRNRIVSGLSLGVVVVEAGQRSGALISARLAMEQNREVFAVPGRIDNRMSQGCHQLLRDGAKLVQSVDDILQELGPLAQPTITENGQTIRKPAELKLTEQETKVLNAIGTDPTGFDQVIAATQLPAPRVLATISVLEMRRLIQRISGTSFVRV
ncbi:MAG: DNA-processing protein DprA [Planctomycetota bacterium]